MEKEDASFITSNFELDKDGRKAILSLNTRIFPLSLVKGVAARFNEMAWVTLDASGKKEVMVELRPKDGKDAEVLARKFNNALVEESAKDMKVDEDNPALLSRLRAVVQDFAKEEHGRVSRQSVVMLGTVLASIGLGSLVAREVTANHMCWGDGDGDAGGAGGGSGSSDGSCCFAPSEIVLTTAGSKPIKDIKRGDSVVSYDARGSSYTVSTVGQVIVHDGKHAPIGDLSRHPLMRIAFQTREGEKTTEVTSNHPYYDPSRKKYKAISMFSIGDEILTKDGPSRIIRKEMLSEEREDGLKPVYNLHMSEGPHNFLVNQAVVHNKTEGGCCFAAGQQVLTPEGLKDISQFKVGEEVVSFDDATRSFTVSTIGQIMVHDGKQDKLPNYADDPLLSLKVEIDGKVIETVASDNHPYLSYPSMKYKPLRDLPEGTRVRMREGVGTISSKEPLIDGDSSSEEQSTPLYNLEMIEGPHNYIVNGAVVHNGGGGGEGGK